VHDLVEQVFLGVTDEVYRALSDTRGLCDVVDRRLLEPVPGERLGGGVEDPAAGVVGGDENSVTVSGF
jgi:hypothetical protein